jgi:hypothetical protein
VSKRQRVVACSSAEAEYISGYENAKSISHKAQILEKLGWPSVGPHIMFVDNTAMMSIAEEWKVGDRTRHMKVRYHYLRSLVIRKEIELWKVDTVLNTADIFTKPLGKRLFEFHRENTMHGVVHPEYIPPNPRKNRRDLESDWMDEEVNDIKRLKH